jgi:hypothetical protein
MFCRRTIIFCQKKIPSRTTGQRPGGAIIFSWTVGLAESHRRKSRRQTREVGRGSEEAVMACGGGDSVEPARVDARVAGDGQGMRGR